jgi:hypothetical protein
MVSGLFSTARELPRLREISMVFVRHGLGDLVRRAGIATLLEHAGHALHWGEATEIAHLEAQQRARLAFEQLGPTFVKLGQMLSTREDLLLSRGVLAGTKNADHPETSTPAPRVSVRALSSSDTSCSTSMSGEIPFA